MTRAEILNCLTDRPCDYCRFHESGRCERWECVFEQKPDDAEDCEDAINRQAVLATLDDTDKFMDEDRTVETYKALLKECYEVLPSVTPKQKIGKWKKYGATKPTCSNCGAFNNSKHKNYCPNCGAKMEVKQNG